MVSKKALLATGVLALGAGVVMLLDRPTAPNDPRLGKALVDPGLAPEVETVDLGKPGGASVKLVKGDDGVWHLGDAQGFPVDAAKVAGFLDVLTRTKVSTVAGSAKADGDAFGLPSATVVGLGAKGKTLASLYLAEARKGGGQYVTVEGGETVYLIGEQVQAQPDAEAWELKTLLDVPKDAVKAVRFEPAAALAKKPAALAREKKEDPLKLEGLADASKEGPAVKTVDSQFGSIIFTKRLDLSNAEAQAALAKPTRVALTLFDGRAYAFDVGSVGDKEKKYFLKIHGTAPDGAGKAEVDALNALMAKNAFEVPQHVATRFEKGQADFVNATPKG